MNEKLMMAEIKELCLTCGKSIDIIAKDCNVSQDLVSALFLDVMSKIFLDMREEGW